MLTPDRDMKYKAKYRMLGTDGGYRFEYFCALCGWHYTTGWIAAGSEAEARLLAEKEARRHFNGCHKCGKWVCDTHYNMDEMMCVACAPQGETDGMTDGLGKLLGGD